MEIIMGVQFKNVHFLPVIIFIWFPSTFLLTYIIAVSFEDVMPLFPYISDTGTYSPESCIFGQLLNTGAILISITIYIRYRIILEIGTTLDADQFLMSLNKTGLWLGQIASLGISIVGNFQETNQFTIHIIGAEMAFGLGTVYQVIQTYISIKLYPSFGEKFMNIIRIYICGTCVIASSVTMLSAVISFSMFKGDDITKWRKGDDGYEYHLASSIAEWFTAILTMSYIFTFKNEFKKIILHEPEIEVINNTTKVITPISSEVRY